MFKILVFLSLFALAFAKPGYIHSAPVLTSYHTATVPIAHVVRPVAAAHSVVAAPVIHHQSALLHGGSYHGSYSHGLY